MTLSEIISIFGIVISIITFIFGICISFFFYKKQMNPVLTFAKKRERLVLSILKKIKKSSENKSNEYIIKIFNEKMSNPYYIFWSIDKIKYNFQIQNKVFDDKGFLHSGVTTINIFGDKYFIGCNNIINEKNVMIGYKDEIYNQIYFLNAIKKKWENI